MTRAKDISKIVTDADLSGTLDVTGTVTAGGLTVAGDIQKTSGDLTLDVAGDIILDADGAQIRLKDNGTQFGLFGNESGDFAIQSSVQDKDIIFQGNDGGVGVTALRLDMSAGGNVLIGTTDNNPAFNDIIGTAIRNDGEMEISASAKVLDINTQTDGDISVFRKDGTTVGNIGTSYGDLYIGTGDTGLRFHDGDNSIYSVNATTGAKINGAVDLGEPAGRFKDLYLSGDITFGDSHFIGNQASSDNLLIQSSGAENIGYDSGNGTHLFYKNGSEMARISNDGHILVGRTSLLTDFGDGRTSLVLQGTGSQDYATIQIGNNGTASDTQILGILAFYDGTENNARVQARRASSTDSADLLFWTRPASGSLQQRLQIDSSGNVLINTTSSSTQQGIFFGNNGQTLLKRGTGGDVIFFVNSGDGSEVGKITILQSSTVYATSSDYRLKESITYDFDATTRLKQLKPCRFNFISDETNTLVDGFLAHEAQAVVPECVTGKKDGVKVWVDGDELPDGVSVGDNKLDADGNTIPDYQGIDQSKLVPLLVKTIQELEARITALETA